MAGRTMQVKGSGPLATAAFVKTKFPDRYREWLESLPPKSKEIYSFPLMASSFYPLYDGLIAPLDTLSRLFYNGDEKCFWETGRHSAGFALKGVYKIFFKFGSAQYIIDRASRVFSTYYPEGELRVADSSVNRCVMQIVKFPEFYRTLEVTIAGWIDGVLELLDKKERKVEITRTMSAGDRVTEYVATWK